MRERNSRNQYIRITRRRWTLEPDREFPLRSHPEDDRFWVAPRHYDNVVRPPSTARVWPVMNVDSCERRKSEA